MSLRLSFPICDTVGTNSVLRFSGQAELDRGPLR